MVLKVQTVFKNTLLAMALFGFLDWVWFSVFMKEFATQRLNSLLLIENSVLQVHLPSAVFVYFVMALMGSLFLVSSLKPLPSIFYKWLWSYFFGFGIYAIFDFTNLALFPAYDFQFAIIDCLWGGFLYSCFGGIVSWNESRRVVKS